MLGAMFMGVNWNPWKRIRALEDAIRRNSYGYSENIKYQNSIRNSLSKEISELTKQIFELSKKCDVLKQELQNKDQRIAELQQMLIELQKGVLDENTPRD